MKRLLILWLLLPLLSAAKVPVESDIKARIEDPASEQYYPNLRLRYEQADSTLTAEDYHYLYYGYAYQPQYRPLETNPALDRFYETLARLNVDAPADTDLLAAESAAYLAESILIQLQNGWKLFFLLQGEWHHVTTFGFEAIRSRRRCSTFSRSPTHSGATRHRRPPTATR